MTLSKLYKISGSLEKSKNCKNSGDFGDSGDSGDSGKSGNSGSSGSAKINNRCPSCQSELSWHHPNRYPVLTQILFAIRFVIFLVLVDKLRAVRYASQIIWIWSLAQIGLGVLLIRGRIAAKKRILRCIRCSTDLR